MRSGRTVGVWDKRRVNQVSGRQRLSEREGKRGVKEWRERGVVKRREGEAQTRRLFFPYRKPLEEQRGQAQCRAGRTVRVDQEAGAQLLLARPGRREQWLFFGRRAATPESRSSMKVAGAAVESVVGDRCSRGAVEGQTVSR